MPVSAGRPFPGSEQQASGSGFTGPGKAIGSGGRAAHGRTSAEAYRKGGVGAEEWTCKLPGRV